MEHNEIVTKDIVDLRKASAEEVEELEAIVLETSKKLIDTTESLKDLEKSLKDLNNSKAFYDEAVTKAKDLMRKAIRSL